MNIEVIEKVQKQFGDGSIFQLSENNKREMEVIPTGITTLDNEILGVGGIPKGRIVEIFGAESSGKTTLCLKVIAQAQKKEPDKGCVIIDAEHSLDPKWARVNEVDTDKLYISQPDSGEEALSIAQELISSGEFSVVVVDSVAALTPQAELDGEMGDANVGLQARLMSQAMRKLRGIVNKSGTILIFTNQIRENIGITFHQGPNKTTPGGRALRFYSSIRLEVTRTGSNTKNDEVVSNKVKIKAVKNKVSAPYREKEFELLFDIGFDVSGDLIDIAIDKGVVKKGGAWFTYLDNKFQGKADFRDFLKEEANLNQLRKAVMC